MPKFVLGPTEKKMSECEKLYNALVKCEACHRHYHKDECCQGLCESCRKFYLDQCCEDCDDKGDN